MTTTTTHYTWQMPDPGGSPNTWGNILNGTTQAIDQQVFTNAQAGEEGNAAKAYTPPPAVEAKSTE